MIFVTAAVFTGRWRYPLAHNWQVSYLLLCKLLLFQFIVHQVYSRLFSAPVFKWVPQKYAGTYFIIVRSYFFHCLNTVSDAFPLDTCNFAADIGMKSVEVEV